MEWTTIVLPIHRSHERNHLDRLAQVHLARKHAVLLAASLVIYPVLTFNLVNYKLTINEVVLLLLFLESRKGQAAGFFHASLWRSLFAISDAAASNLVMVSRPHVQPTVAILSRRHRLPDGIVVFTNPVLGPRRVNFLRASLDNLLALQPAPRRSLCIR
jgi:hypothetical protein